MIAYALVFVIGGFAGFYMGNALFRAKFNEKTKELIAKIQQSQTDKKTKTKRMKINAK